MGKHLARRRSGPNFESLIHKIGRVETSDTVEDFYSLTRKLCYP